jgi:serine/threonine protein kinase
MAETSEGKIGKYEIIGVLGRGGMGEVLLGLDRDLGRRVAIKRPFKSAMEDGLARFQLEAKAATLNHRNIPSVYEMGIQDGLPFIAMEYVEGESLDKILTSGKELDLITKLSIIEQVCLAIGYAHEKGIIHRDIKPANVLVQPNGVVKIIDFGIAKMQSPDSKSGLTQTSQIIGSLHYIAPERFKGEAADGRADIFSTGVMLYLLLTGNLPFPGNEATAAYKIVNEAQPPLGTTLHNYPPALDAILDHALAKHPGQRYATAEDFGDALHEVIEELKSNRVEQLFGDAERLTTERRYEPALQLLNEAIALDPANTQVRKLRKFLREQQDKSRREESLRALLTRAEEALSSRNYQEALASLKDASELDPSNTELRQRIHSVEEKKRLSESAGMILAKVESLRDKDVNGALQIVDKALADDPENSRLLIARGAVIKQAEVELKQVKLRELLESARTELASRNFSKVQELIQEARGIDQTNPDVDKLANELTKLKEMDERRRLVDEIQRRVNEFVRTDNFEQAATLLDRAIDKLPSETSLHRLKAEVDAEARRFQSKRFVDESIARVQELFTHAPAEALTAIQAAIEQMPGEERLIACERSLQQQFESVRLDQLCQDALRNARELLDAHQFDKAISALESFQIEFGSRPDIEDFLAFAREEHATWQRRERIEQCMAKARALIRDGHGEEAVQCLESGLEATGDASLSRLLEGYRENQLASARKVDALLKHATQLRERNELDQAIELLQEHGPTELKNPQVRDLLASLLAEREHKQAIANAMATARHGIEQGDFTAGWEALHAVQQAYGESAELSRDIEWFQAARAAHAQEVVGKSIDAARAALLKSDGQAAVAALMTASAMVPFADAQKQNDWRRIGQSAEQTLQRGTSVSTDPTRTEANFGSQIERSSKAPILAIAAGCLLLIAVALLLWWKLYLPQTREAHIRIAKAPPGAMVSIDHDSPRAIDSSGKITVQVQPGERVIEVTKPGFEPFSDKIAVGSGETVNYPSIALTQTPIVGTSGKLIPQGNLAEFKLTVDGQYRGLLHQGDQISLEAGTHTVSYAAIDNSDLQQHSIVLAANQSLVDPFILKTPATAHNKPGGQTQPGSHVADNGDPAGKDSPAHIPTTTAPNAVATDEEQIQEAHDRFEAAYSSKNIATLQREWLNIGSERIQVMQDIFKRAKIVKIKEKCSGQPVVTGQTAEWRCKEIVQLDSKFFGPSTKTLEFEKRSSRWVLKDK